MAEIDIQQLLLLVMKTASEYATMNQNMERVAHVLEQVENNEIDLIGRNKGLNTQLKDLMDAIKGWDQKTISIIADVFKELRSTQDLMNTIANKDFSGNVITADAIKVIFQEQVDKRLLMETDKTSKQKDRWIRILLIVAIALLLVILTMIGLDIAGVFDMARGIASVFDMARGIVA